MAVFGRERPLSLYYLHLLSLENGWMVGNRGEREFQVELFITLTKWP